MSQQDDDLRDELTETAFHEACHFVMGRLAKGGLPRKVSILREGNDAGFCGGCPALPRYPGYAALFCLAGVFAEEVIIGGAIDPAQVDMEGAKDELQQGYGEAWEREYDKYQDFTFKLLSYTGPRRAIQAVAEYLLDNPNLELEAVYPLVDLAEKAIGRRLRWLEQQVTAFVEGGASCQHGH